jgi:hypothetical protein
LLGIQPRLPPPGRETPFPLPPPPSQSHLPPQLPSPSRTATGPLFDIHPFVGVSEEYSDNFRISATDPVDNFRTMISPGVTIGVNGPRTRGTVSTSLSFTQDTVNNFGDLGFFPAAYAAVKHAFSPRFSLSLVDAFARSDEPALASQFGLEQQRQVFTSNSLSLSADWLVDIFATQGYYQLLTFSGTNDTVSHILGTNVGAPIGALTAVKAGYELSESTTTGPNPTSATGGLVWGSIARQIASFTALGVSTSYAWQNLESTRIWNVSLLMAHQLPGRISLSGSVGYSSLASDSGDFSTISTNSSISYRFGRAIAAIAVFQDFIQTSLQAGENFGITLTRSYTGTLGYALTPLVDLSLRASYNDNDFTGVGNQTSASDSSAIVAGAGVVWRIRQWLTMAIDYAHTRYESAPSTNGVAVENSATIRFLATF